jgi:hypothetical protein
MTRFKPTPTFTPIRIAFVGAYLTAFIVLALDLFVWRVHTGVMCYL